MVEYIDKDIAIQICMDACDTGEASQNIKDESSADVLPVVHAKWIIDDKEWSRIWHCHCSNCRKDPQDYIGGSENWWLVRLPDFCPCCGAKMDKEEE